MKTTLFLAAALAVLVGLSAFVSVKVHFADIFQQLAIQQEEAKETIFGDFQQGSLNIPYSTAIKALIPGKRAAAVKELGDYIRKYSSSPEFVHRYKAQWDAEKPAAPAEGAEKLTIRLAEIKHDLEENEKGLAESKGDIKTLYEATIRMLKTEQKALLDAKDPQHETFMSGLTGGAGSMDPEQYKEAMEEYKKYHPVTVNELVKQRLQAFLDLTKDIDFSARLVVSGGLKKFADPKLEAKGGDWKRCYRCGEETITAARAYASQWLKELK